MAQTKDVTAGYRRWLRAETNAALQPKSRAAQKYRLRLEIAREVAAALPLPSTTRVVEKTSGRDVSRYYMCSTICAAMQIQLERRGVTSAADLFPLLEADRYVLWENAFSYGRSSHEVAVVPRVGSAVRCRACNATINPDDTVDATNQAIDFWTSLTAETRTAPAPAERELLDEISASFVEDRVLDAIALASQDFVLGSSHGARVEVLRWLRANPAALDALRG